jgi:5-methylcytosine-specific restriction endonuclease McrA
LPRVVPSAEEILEALTLLGMTENNVRCVYCGAVHTTWDHLRPIVVNQRPTGFISEIGNLVPACGPCNSSKRNEDWRTWMLGGADKSPSRRSPEGLAERVARLDAYVAWRPPTHINFAALVGEEEWERYWSLSAEINVKLKEAQASADHMRRRVEERLREATA